MRTHNEGVRDLDINEHIRLTRTEDVMPLGENEDCANGHNHYHNDHYRYRVYHVSDNEQSD